MGNLTSYVVKWFQVQRVRKCVYYKGTPDNYVIVCLYVDDILIMGSNRKIIVDTKRMLERNFDMNDMSLADVILGIKIMRTPKGISLSQ